MQVILVQGLNKVFARFLDQLPKDIAIFHHGHHITATLLERAVKLNPSSFLANHNLALVYIELGRAQEAAQYLARARDLVSSESHARMLQRTLEMLKGGRNRRPTPKASVRFIIVPKKPPASTVIRAACQLIDFESTALACADGRTGETSAYSIQLRAATAPRRTVSSPSRTRCRWRR